MVILSLYSPCRTAFSLSNAFSYRTGRHCVDAFTQSQCKYKLFPMLFHRHWSDASLWTYQKQLPSKASPTIFLMLARHRSFLLIPIPIPARQSLIHTHEPTWILFSYIQYIAMPSEHLLNFPRRTHRRCRQAYYFVLFDNLLAIIDFIGNNSKSHRLVRFSLGSQQC